MKVRELMEVLRHKDPEKEVEVWNTEDLAWEQIDHIVDTTRSDGCRCCPPVPIVGIRSY